MNSNTCIMVECLFEIILITDPQVLIHPITKYSNYKFPYQYYMLMFLIFYGCIQVLKWLRNNKQVVANNEKALLLSICKVND